MPTIENTRRLKEAKGEYDVVVDGGAIGTLTLRASADDTLGNDIPRGAVIEGGYIEVEAALTSGGLATVAANADGVGDLLAAAAIGGVPWSAPGRQSLLPVFTGASTVKTTARRSLAISIATAALTAGRFRVVVFYR
ncbi:MAG: hypothetical protein HYR62_01920 [Actinobacteria bacterium]|nr:hypothetical protein [Actinomycetota bacterium]MBI3687240.1 hypothetical protein [Actinomycetota bacterium]